MPTILGSMVAMLGFETGSSMGLIEGSMALIGVEIERIFHLC
jgi:hypothetical protein